LRVRALAGEERPVVVVDVRRDEVGRLGVGAREEDGRHAHDVGGEPRGDQFLDRLARRDEHLAAHVAALLDRGQLVLEVDARGARLDHRLHQLEGVQHAAETGLGVGDDRREVVDVPLALGMLDLVGAHERVVDALDHARHRVDRIERLVRVHLARDVGIGSDLPARQVDRLQAGLDLLHRLVAGERAQRADEGLVVHELPQLLGAAPRERVLDVQRTAQAHDVLRRVAAPDALPARILRPVLLESCRFQVVVHRRSPIVTSGLARPAGGRRFGGARRPLTADAPPDVTPGDAPGVARVTPRAVGDRPSASAGLGGVTWNQALLAGFAHVPAEPLVTGSHANADRHCGASGFCAAQYQKNVSISMV